MPRKVKPNKVNTCKKHITVRTFNMANFFVKNKNIVRILLLSEYRKSKVYQFPTQTGDLSVLEIERGIVIFRKGNGNRSVLIR